MSTQKISMALRLLRDAEEKISTARHLLKGNDNETTKENNKAMELDLEKSTTTNIVEGIYDGQSMIGADKKIYPIPANYASKSKLVEGDTLKLTILDNGSFIYKQIGPVERQHLRGQLKKDARDEYCVQVDKSIYKVLTASVTYFKGVEGDEVTIVLPRSGEAKWAAIENIIKNSQSGDIPELVRESMKQLHQSADINPASEGYDAKENREIPISEVEDQ